MCKYMNGSECECELVDSNICKNTSDCEYLEDNSIDIEDLLRGNDDLYWTLHDRIVFEIKNLIKSYEWFWSKEDQCFIDGSGNDIADVTYYEWNNELIHPKILLTYMEEYLLSKEIAKYLRTIPGIKTVESYYYKYRNENHIYKITRTEGFLINFRDINKEIKKTYYKEIEIIEYNHDEKGDFVVIKLLL